MLLGTLGAAMLRNMSAGKEVMKVGKGIIIAGKGVSRARKGVVRERRGYSNMGHIDKNF